MFHFLKTSIKFIILFNILIEILYAQNFDIGNFKQEFNLGKIKNKEVTFFQMITKVFYRSSDGKATGKDEFLLLLKYLPEKKNESIDQYRCEKFMIKQNEKPYIRIQDLENRTYSIDKDAGLD